MSEVETVLLNDSKADLLLLDLHIPGAHGFVGLAHVTQHYPQLPVVMISAHEGVAVAASAQQYGALGFIPKSATIADMTQSIEQVLSGELCFPAAMNEYSAYHEQETDVLVEKVAQLTPKQLEVFNLLANGLLNKQIAYEQHVTEATVKAHVTAIMRKLSVSNRSQVVLIASKIDIAEAYGSET